MVPAPAVHPLAKHSYITAENSIRDPIDFLIPLLAWSRVDPCSRVQNNCSSLVSFSTGEVSSCTDTTLASATTQSDVSFLALVLFMSYGRSRWGPRSGGNAGASTRPHMCDDIRVSTQLHMLITSELLKSCDIRVSDWWMYNIGSCQKFRSLASVTWTGE